MTLGFKPKHQYNAQQLKAICSVFAEILKHKGSIKALKIACEALFNSMDIDQALDYDFTDGNKTELNLYIPPEFEDFTILKDLLAYVLPAGMSCNIIREFHILTESNTNIGISDTVTKSKINTKEISKVIKDFTDVSVANISNKAGFSVNSEIIKLEDKNNG
jgi:hypothetical protein